MPNKVDLPALRKVVGATRAAMLGIAHELDTPDKDVCSCILNNQRLAPQEFIVSFSVSRDSGDEAPPEHVWALPPNPLSACVARTLQRRRLPSGEQDIDVLYHYVIAPMPQQAPTALPKPAETLTL